MGVETYLPELEFQIDWYAIQDLQTFSKLQSEQKPRSHSRSRSLGKSEHFRQYSAFKARNPTQSKVEAQTEQKKPSGIKNRWG